MTSKKESQDTIIVGYPGDDPVYWASTSDTAPVDDDGRGEWRIVGPVFLVRDPESAVLNAEAEWWTPCPPDWPGARPFVEHQRRGASPEEIAKYTAVDAPPLEPLPERRSGRRG